MLPKNTFRPASGLAALPALVFAFAFVFNNAAFAQAVTQPASTSSTSPAAGGDATAADDDDDIVIMTPFEVTAHNKDDGRYETSRSNAITGTNLPLERVPLTANIFNQAFLEDMDVVDITEMLTKYAGFGVPTDQATSGAGTRGAEPGDRTTFHNLSVRGLGAGVTRREGFLLSEGTTLDSFDVETVEQVNGSQSLIYGAGNAGGVVNFIGKRAKFNSRYGKVKFKFDTEGSRRYEAEANYGTKNFAVTAIGIKDDTLVWKPGLERHHEGYYAAVSVRPTSWLVLRGEYRNFNRVATFAQSAEINVPNQYLPDWALANSGDPNQTNRRIRYFLYREGEGFLGYNWSNADSPIIISAGKIDHEYYGVAAEARVTRNFSLQLRYGNDERTNFALMNSSAPTVYHPESAASSRDAYFPELKGQWAYRLSPNENYEHAGSTFQSQKGLRLAGNLRFNTGGFAHHEFNFSGQSLKSRNKRVGMRFYKVGADGEFVYADDVSNANRVAWNSATNNSDAYWVPAYSQGFPVKWPFTSFVLPAGGGTGGYPYREATTYRLAPIKVPGFTDSTAENPLGLNGGSYTSDGNLSAAYRILDTEENAVAGALMSSWWDNHITTMLGYRYEVFTIKRQNTGIDPGSGRDIHKRGPLNKNTFTAGIVYEFVRNISAFVSHSTNTNVKQDFEQLDVYNNPVPFGEGMSNEFGFKFKLFKNHINGSASVYKTRVKNETVELYDWRAEIDRRAMIDPDGLNGYSLSVSPTPKALRDRTSQGFGMSLSTKPMRGWEMTLRYTFADGKTGSDVVLPIYNNDTFNTITEGGETYVARRLENGSLEKVMVPDNSADYKPDTPTDPAYTTPLTIGMMNNSESSWYVNLNPYGWIRKDGDLNPAYNILRQDDVRTGLTGQLISNAPNQFGFVSPEFPDGYFLLEGAGEKTTGYAVNTFAMENNFNIRSGWFKGLQLGVQVQYQRDVRGFYYYTRNDDGSRRRELWMTPNNWNMDASARYEFQFGKRMLWVIQLNVVNVLDKFDIYPSVDGTGKIIVARPAYAPRRFVLTNTIKF
jgi:outer membrane receptor protein involved in Fe transport